MSSSILYAPLRQITAILYKSSLCRSVCCLKFDSSSIFEVFFFFLEESNSIFSSANVLLIKPIINVYFIFNLQLVDIIEFRPLCNCFFENFLLDEQRKSDRLIKRVSKKLTRQGKSLSREWMKSTLLLGDPLKTERGVAQGVSRMCKDRIGG